MGRVGYANQIRWGFEKWRLACGRHFYAFAKLRSLGNEVQPFQRWEELFRKDGGNFYFLDFSKVN